MDKHLEKKLAMSMARADKALGKKPTWTKKELKVIRVLFQYDTSTPIRIGEMLPKITPTILPKITFKELSELYDKLLDKSYIKLKGNNYISNIILR